MNPKKFDIALAVFVYLILIPLTVWIFTRGDELPACQQAAKEQAEHESKEAGYKISVHPGDEFLCFFNEARTQEGLPELRRVNQDVSFERSSAVANGTIDGTIHERFAEDIAGMPYIAAGEIISWDEPDTHTVFKSFMKSPKHRDVILGDFEEFSYGSTLTPESFVYVLNFWTMADR